jgi:hypothetical protein
VAGSELAVVDPAPNEGPDDRPALSAAPAGRGAPEPSAEPPADETGGTNPAQPRPAEPPTSDRAGSAEADDAEDGESEVVVPANAATRRAKDRSLQHLYGVTFTESGERTQSAVSGSQVHGSIYTVAGGGTVINNTFGSTTPTTAMVAGPLSNEGLDRLRALYIPAANDDELTAALENRLQPLIMIAGSRGTGRRHRALAVLDTVTRSRPHGTGRTEPLRYLASGTTLEALARESGLAGARGYVLDATGAPWVRNADLALVSQVLERLSGREKGGAPTPSPLVILVDDDVADVPATVVRHERPDPLSVLERHLAVRLGLSAEETHELVGNARESPQVDGIIDHLCLPWSAVAVAMALSNWYQNHARDQKETPHLYFHQRWEAMRQARSMLRGACEAEATTRAQAFVIGAAALDGAPVSRVVDASHALAQLLHDANENETPPPGSLFDEPLSRWLHHVEIRDPDTFSRGQLISDDRTIQPQLETPVVRLHEPVMAGAILEVAWSEYDQARLPILRWLSTLCASADPDVLQLAALAVGKIATLDFEVVNEQLFQPWAGLPSLRPALALALESVIADGRRDRHVLRLLERWATRDIRRKAIAINAYGTRIGALYPMEAFKGIERAFRGQAVLGPRVDAAMTEIYLAGRRPEVLGRLTEWSAAPGWNRSRAAACLIRLANLRYLAEGGTQPTDVPDLIAKVRDVDQLDEVARIWTIALKERDVVRDAWDLLGRWKAIGEEQPDVAHVADDVISRVSHEPAMAGRLHFHERRWQLGREKERREQEHR